MTEQTSKGPAFDALVVREGSNGKAYFTNIGAVWPTKEGKGFRVVLSALPINGELLLMPRKTKAQDDAIEHDETDPSER
jgi:hypothetical protein